MSHSIDDIVEITRVMLIKEATSYCRFDYLASSSTGVDTSSINIPQPISNVVDESWRQKIIEWMYGVVDHCGLRRDSVAVAANYVDLCVIKGIVQSRERFQLVAMTALQLAIKLYDSTVVKLDSLVKLGRGLFTENDVLATESEMLRVLGWQVHPPTSICFLRQYLSLLPASVSPISRYILTEITRFIAEVSVCMYNFINYPPSVVAYAGLIIAMARLDEPSLPSWQRTQICSLIHRVTGGMSQGDDIVIQCVELLTRSLEKNVSLQDLLNTISTQCHYSYMQMNGSAVNNLSTPSASIDRQQSQGHLEVTQQQPRRIRHDQQSPRGVVVATNKPTQQRLKETCKCA
jgi:hypothetical protein